MGGTLTHTGLREAVIDGALLRLRPKVMTVSTVIAGLLPIMWSSRVGAEVMKPLAAPVLGGMVSSLLHVLIVTPVIFYWIHERRLGLAALERRERREHQTTHAAPGSSGSVRPSVSWRSVGAVVVVIAAVAIGAWWVTERARTGTTSNRTTGLSAVQAVRSGDVTIALVASDGRLRQGRNVFGIEFRSTKTGELLDVGDVRAGVAMPMPGMVMSGGLTVTASGRPGRYDAVAEFGMAGLWKWTIEWSGPSGSGSVAFEGSVQ